MKRIFLSLIALCLISGISYAQIETRTLTITPVKKGDEPKAVMDALKQDFPAAEVSGLNTISPLLYGRKWSETLTKDSDTDTIDFLQVDLREAGQRYQAVYDKNGKILHTKWIIKNAELPQPVLQTLATKYPDYRIISDREKITSGKDENTHVVYRVEIQRGAKGMLRNLFLDPTGKILRDVHLPRV